MGTEPPPFVSFKKSAGPKPEPKLERFGVYQRALDFSQQLFTIIELTEGVERWYVRDILDKKSTAIPMMISRGCATADMSARRESFRKARQAVTDCAAILDVLQQRGTVEPEVLDSTRATATALGAELDALTVEPPKPF